MAIKENKGVYIPSIDAKDLYIANNYLHKNRTGYSLRQKNGDINLRKFINSLDYSLDLIKLREIYERVCRRRDFTFDINKKSYTQNVINVTFNYANKEFNRIHGNEYVKFGYEANNLEFIDNVCLIDNELIAIRVNTQVKHTVSKEILGKYFSVKKEKTKSGETQCVYTVSKSIPVLTTTAELRTILYKEGFYCNGVKYVRLKRTAGSSRVGKCLFIAEKLYKPMHKWEMCGLQVEEGQEIDLAALESYISLPTSSIIDTMELLPHNFLVIDDYDSIFKDNVVSTSIRDKSLFSRQEETEIKNSIWDGQSLIDISSLGEYAQYGMVLLRNRFFKSCCFNTNIQKWFKDNNIEDISQLNGFTLAKNIEDIKIITTPSSIKYLKFGSVEQWFEELDSLFGIVKHDKPTHYFDGRLVQTHYQLINTLQLTKEEVEEFLQPSLDFIRLLRTDPAVVRYYIKYPEDRDIEVSPMLTKNDIVYNLMSINNKFSKTKLYQDFLNDLVKSYIKNLKRGHVLINGNYSTILGNPMEMLNQAIGKFDGQTQLGINNIHSKRFEYNKTILGSRSPHVTMGNLWLPHNVESKEIDNYFNLTKEIVCINSIDENCLQRLNGADFDSDTVLLTDNSILINAAQRNYDIFKVPTSSVEAKKTSRYYTAEEKADLDIKTSINLIGEVINMSQVLNSLYWDNIFHGQTHEQNFELYCDICTLSVMSGIEIDKAKKEFIVDTGKELNKIRNKYKEQLTDSITGKNIQPHFFAHISRAKGYYNPEKKAYTKHETSMDYLQTVINSFRIRSVQKKVYEPFSSILDDSKFRKDLIYYDQVNRVIELVRNLNNEIKAIWAKEHLDGSTKHDLTCELRQECINYINSLKFSYSTMYWLLYLIEQPDYSDIQKTLLSILLGSPNVSFFEVLKESSEEIETVSENIQGDLKIYDVNHIKITKNR